MHFNCLPEYVKCVLICSLIPDGVGGRGWRGWRGGCGLFKSSIVLCSQ